jgi:hypothetical protein
MDWNRNDKIFPAGTFAPRGEQRDGQPPFPLLDNVVAVKGEFKDTIQQLTPIIGDRPLALIHIDSDTYQSAIDGLAPLIPLLNVGTVLVFDEFYNYDGFEDGKFRAFAELIIDGGFYYTVLAFNEQHQQVVIQITGLPYELTDPVDADGV